MNLLSGLQNSQTSRLGSSRTRHAWIGCVDPEAAETTSRIPAAGRGTRREGGSNRIDARSGATTVHSGCCGARGKRARPKGRFQLGRKEPKRAEPLPHRSRAFVVSPLLCRHDLRK